MADLVRRIIYEVESTALQRNMQEMREFLALTSGARPGEGMTRSAGEAADQLGELGAQARETFSDFARGAATAEQAAEQAAQAIEGIGDAANQVGRSTGAFERIRDQFEQGMIRTIGDATQALRTLQAAFNDATNDQYRQRIAALIAQIEALKSTLEEPVSDPFMEVTARLESGLIQSVQDATAAIRLLQGALKGAVSGEERTRIQGLISQLEDLRGALQRTSSIEAFEEVNRQIEEGLVDSVAKANAALQMLESALEGTFSPEEQARIRALTEEVQALRDAMAAASRGGTGPRQRDVVGEISAQIDQGLIRSVDEATQAMKVLDAAFAAALGDEERVRIAAVAIQLDVLKRSLEGTAQGAALVDQTISRVTQELATGAYRSITQTTMAANALGQAFKAAVTDEQRQQIAALALQVKELAVSMETLGQSDAMPRMVRPATSAREAVRSLNFVLQDSSMFATSFSLGLMAIGNNIPFLVERMAELRQGTNSWKAASTALLGAFTGPAGLVAVVSLATTLFIAFGDDILGAFTGGTKAVKEFRKQLEGVLSSLIEVGRTEIRLRFDTSELPDALRTVQEELEHLERRRLANIQLVGRGHVDPQLAEQIVALEGELVALTGAQVEDLNKQIALRKGIVAELEKEVTLTKILEQAEQAVRVARFAAGGPLFTLQEQLAKARAEAAKLSQEPLAKMKPADRQALAAVNQEIQRLKREMEALQDFGIVDPRELEKALEALQKISRAQALVNTLTGEQKRLLEDVFDLEDQIKDLNEISAKLGEDAVESQRRFLEGRLRGARAALALEEQFRNAVKEGAQALSGLSLNLAAGFDAEESIRQISRQIEQVAEGIERSTGLIRTTITPRIDEEARREAEGQIRSLEEKVAGITSSIHVEMDEEDRENALAAVEGLTEQIEEIKVKVLPSMDEAARNDAERGLQALREEASRLKDALSVELEGEIDTEGAARRIQAQLAALTESLEQQTASIEATVRPEVDRAARERVETEIARLKDRLASILTQVTPEMDQAARDAVLSEVEALAQQIDRLRISVLPEIDGSAQADVERGLESLQEEARRLQDALSVEFTGVDAQEAARRIGEQVQTLTEQLQEQAEIRPAVRPVLDTDAQQRVEAEVARLEDQVSRLTASVTPEMDAQARDNVLAEIDDLSAQIDLIRVGVLPELDEASQERARRGLEQLQEEARRLKDVLAVELSTAVDTEQAAQDVQEHIEGIRERVERQASVIRASIRPDVDENARRAAESEVEQLQERVARLSASITPEMDDGARQEAVRDVQRLSDQISSIELAVLPHLDEAARQETQRGLSALQEQARQLQEALQVSVSTDVDPDVAATRLQTALRSITEQVQTQAGVIRASIAPELDAEAQRQALGQIDSLREQVKTIASRVTPYMDEEARGETVQDVEALADLLREIEVSVLPSLDEEARNRAQRGLEDLRAEAARLQDALSVEMDAAIDPSEAARRLEAQVQSITEQVERQAAVIETQIKAVIDERSRQDALQSLTSLQDQISEIRSSLKPEMDETARSQVLDKVRALVEEVDRIESVILPVLDEEARRKAEQGLASIREEAERVRRSLALGLSIDLDAETAARVLREGMEAEVKDLENQVALIKATITPEMDVEARRRAEEEIAKLQEKAFRAVEELFTLLQRDAPEIARLMGLPLQQTIEKLRIAPEQERAFMQQIDAVMRRLEQETEPLEMRLALHDLPRAQRQEMQRQLDEMRTAAARQMQEIFNDATLKLGEIPKVLRDRFLEVLPELKVPPQIVQDVQRDFDDLLRRVREKVAPLQLQLEMEEDPQAQQRIRRHIGAIVKSAQDELRTRLRDLVERLQREGASPAVIATVQGMVDALSSDIEQIATGMDKAARSGEKFHAALSNVAASIRAITRVADAFGDLDEQVRRVLDGIADVIDNLSRLQTFKATIGREGPDAGSLAAVAGQAVPVIGAVAGAISVVQGLIKSNQAQKEEMEKLREALRDNARAYRQAATEIFRGGRVGDEETQARLAEARRQVWEIQSAGGVGARDWERRLQRLGELEIEGLEKIPDLAQTLFQRLEEVFGLVWSDDELREAVNNLLFGSGQFRGFDLREIFGDEFDFDTVTEILARFSEQLGQATDDIPGAIQQLRFFSEFLTDDVQEAFQHFLDFLLKEGSDVFDKLRQSVADIEGVGEINLADLFEEARGLDIGTEAGRERLSEIIQLIAANFTAFLDVLSPTDLEAVLSELKRLAEEAAEGLDTFEAALKRFSAAQQFADTLGFTPSDLQAMLVRDLEGLGDAISQELVSQIAGIDLSTEEGLAAFDALIRQLMEAIVDPSGELLEALGLTEEQAMSLLGAFQSLKQSVEDVTNSLGRFSNAQRFAEDLGLSPEELRRLLVEDLRKAGPAISQALVDQLEGIDLTTDAGEEALQDLIKQIMRAVIDPTGDALRALGLTEQEALALISSLQALRQATEETALSFTRFGDAVRFAEDLGFTPNQLRDIFVRELEEIGPALSDAFAALVAGLDLTTEEGREQLNMLANAVRRAIYESLTEEQFGLTREGAEELLSNLEALMGAVQPQGDFSRSVQIARTINEIQANELIAIADTQLFELRKHSSLLRIIAEGIAGGEIDLGAVVREATKGRYGPEALTVKGAISLTDDALSDLQRILESIGTGEGLSPVDDRLQTIAWIASTIAQTLDEIRAALQDILRNFTRPETPAPEQPDRPEPPDLPEPERPRPTPEPDKGDVSARIAQDERSPLEVTLDMDAFSRASEDLTEALTRALEQASDMLTEAISRLTRQIERLRPVEQPPPAGDGAAFEMPEMAPVVPIPEVLTRALSGIQRASLPVIPPSVTEHHRTERAFNISVPVSVERKGPPYFSDEERRDMMEGIEQELLRAQWGYTGRP